LYRHKTGSFVAAFTSYFDSLISKAGRLKCCGGHEGAVISFNVSSERRHGVVDLEGTEVQEKWPLYLLRQF
jgi:hypothetical protein